jgi:hypothetical protein
VSDVERVESAVNFVKGMQQAKWEREALASACECPVGEMRTLLEQSLDCLLMEATFHERVDTIAALRKLLGRK